MVAHSCWLRHHALDHAVYADGWVWIVRLAKRGKKLDVAFRSAHWRSGESDDGKAGHAGTSEDLLEDFAMDRRVADDTATADLSSSGFELRLDQRNAQAPGTQQACRNRKDQIEGDEGNVDC